MPKYDATEEQRKLAEQMGDFEFEQEVDSYMGDYGRGAADADAAVFHDIGDNMLGFPQEGGGARVVHGLYLGNQDDVKYWSEKLSDVIGRGGVLDPEEYGEDKVHLFGPTGISGDTPPHEFLHKMHDEQGIQPSANAHQLIYMMMGYRARTLGEWEDAVESYAGWQGIDDYDKAENILRSLLINNMEKLSDLEARAGMEGRAMAPNLPDNEYDEVARLKAYEEQARRGFDSRRRRISYELGLEEDD